MRSKQKKKGEKKISSKKQNVQHHLRKSIIKYNVPIGNDVKANTGALMVMFSGANSKWVSAVYSGVRKKEGFFLPLIVIKNNGNNFTPLVRK